ncbi:hypothetical protein [Enterovibrio norvegicus]|uniref:hypothetical protein n=1 Tax=Enterovibrio norvegicus TaxID=188144 RepID=UPI0002E3F192|nr:hypothetical protein [Enterovibrio norvegicus]OEF57983.1 hypothetical protein A1OU_07185 [Enterovibrio norvegicus]
MRYNSSRIQHDTRSITIDGLIDMVQVGRLDPMPVTEVLPRLSLSAISQIIESLILGLPSEIIWAQQNRFGKVHLLSGFDIVYSILEFRFRGLRLKRLKVLKHLEGLSFEEIDYVEIKNLLQMEVSLGMIYNDSDPMLKCLFVDRVNRPSYGKQSAQLARSVIFIDAESLLRDFTIKLFGDLYDGSIRELSFNSKQFRKHFLKIQNEILYCLFLVIIKNKESWSMKNVAMESYSHYRSNLSKYSDYKSAEISLSDSLEMALNKIMLMLQIEPVSLGFELSVVEDYIYKIMKNEDIDFRTVGASFSYSSVIGRDNKFSLVEYFYSYYLNQRPHRLKFSVEDEVGDLVERFINV